MAHLEITHFDREGKIVRTVTVTRESFPVASRRIMRQGLMLDSRTIAPGAILEIREIK